MPLEAALIELMLDTVEVELVSLNNAGEQIRDKYGEFTYDDPEEFQCQVTRMSRRTVDRSGHEVTSTAQVIFADPELALTEDAMITLGEADRRAIIRIMKAKDDTGPYLLEAWV